MINGDGLAFVYAISLCFAFLITFVITSDLYSLLAYSNKNFEQLGLFLYRTFIILYNNVYNTFFITISRSFEDNAFIRYEQFLL